MKQDARTKAAQAGLTRYRGPICRKDAEHGTLRYTSSGQCVECCNQASKIRVNRIRDALKAAKSLIPLEQ